jgi:hypothetical protein
MKMVMFVSSMAALLAFSEARAMPQGEVISGFQCVGINVKGLQLSQDDLRSGAKFPWILDKPSEDAKPVARVATIIYIVWPPVVENGFLKAMSLGGKVGWVDQNSVSRLRRADGTTGGCILARLPNGRITFYLDPGVGVNN